MRKTILLITFFTLVVLALFATPAGAHGQLPYPPPETVPYPAPVDVFEFPEWLQNIIDAIEYLNQKIPRLHRGYLPVRVGGFR